MEKKNLLLAVTASVATIKLLPLIEAIKSCKQVDMTIRIVMTKNSQHFITKREVIQQTGLDVYDDEDEWSQWSGMNDPVLHIELRNWADIMLIAPLDANTLAKMVNGICDNLLTCIVRAWDNRKYLIYCPAMNTHMYNHPITGEHLKKLDTMSRYVRVDCVEKKLACGDYGMGGMAPVDVIANQTVNCILNG